MVTFGLFGRSKQPLSYSIPSGSMRKEDKTFSVLDELMGLNTVHTNGIDNNRDNDHDNSSFILDNLMKTSYSNINYKDALLNSLYSQVEFLRQELLGKDEIIKLIINKSVETPVKSNMCSSVYSNDDRNTTKLATIIDETNESIQDRYSLSVSNISRCTSDSIEYNTRLDIDEQLASVRRLKSLDYHNNAENETSFGAWEKHSSGFGSKMLRKMGYTGAGLGKFEDGIINPISVERRYGRRTMGIACSNQRAPFINRGLRNLLSDVTHTNNHVNLNKRIENKVMPWPANTTLITGSSIICGLEENRLRKYKVKVRPCPGAYVDDMHDYLKPLLKKKPTNIIIHIGSNDSFSKTADAIANEISNLKDFIQNKVPNANIFMSCPTLRLDNAKANSTLRELKEILKSTHKVIVNDNIDGSCLGRKGLHLNPKGSGRLAMNYISLLRRL